MVVVVRVSEYARGFQDALELVEKTLQKIRDAVVEKKLDRVKRELGI